MTTTRKQYSPQFKARVAMEAIRGERTLSQLGSQFKVHPMQIAKWRKAAIDQLPELFVDGRTRKASSDEADTDVLYQEIGRLKVELDWLKKKSACSTESAYQLGVNPARCVQLIYEPSTLRAELQERWWSDRHALGRNCALSVSPGGLLGAAPNIL